VTLGPRVFVCAGEPSGDRHAADVARALSAASPSAVIHGVGGTCLAAAGVSLDARLEQLSATGAVEPVQRLAAHVGLLWRLRRHFREGRYDLVILVDYPGFNLRVAGAAAAAGIPVLYYIAPQAWAWAPRRAERLRRAVGALAVILPFEEAFFAARGVRTRFVGHPLLDVAYPARAGARHALAVDGDRPLVGLFPGSRPAEVRRLWPRLREAARCVRDERPEAVVAVAAVRGCRYPGADSACLVWDRAADVLAAADVALCKAGTITLEAAIVGVPSVVAYVADPVSYAIGRRVVRVPFMGLANLVAGRAIAPELIQGAATAQRLAAAALPLLDRQGAAADRQRAAYATVRQRLGEPGAAGRAAAMALDLVA
jgi:lipid-A-disaccharide synthase